MIEEEKINELIEKRLTHLNEDDIESADKIEESITKSIMTYYPLYSIDFIIETLTKFGQAPNLVYDDNGLFAVSGTGLQPVVYDDQKLDGSITVIVESEMWFPTIRKALYHYLKN